MKAKLRAAGIASGLLLLLSAPANADAVCGPGKHLASDAFRCLPGDGGSRAAPRASGNNTANQVAAGLAVGAAVLSIVQSLASQSRMTDNTGPVLPTREVLGNQSRRYNREGLALQRSGKFDEARRAFVRAASDAGAAGNTREAEINRRNADIADALHWLRNGFEAEKEGKLTKANVSYKMGIDAATRAGSGNLVRKLKVANDKLVKGNKGGNMISSDQKNCRSINGKYTCF